jgi:hypothetical protein
MRGILPAFNSSTKSRPIFSTSFGYCRHGRFLQIVQDEIEHLFAHMPDQLRVGETMALFRIDHKLELLAGFLQFVNELDRVLNMHVVINGAVNQQQFARKILCGFDDRAFFITFGIVLRRKDANQSRARPQCPS